MTALSDLTMAEIALVHQSLTCLRTTIKTFNTKHRGISRLEAILNEKGLTVAEALRAAGLEGGRLDTGKSPSADAGTAVAVIGEPCAEPAVVPALTAIAPAGSEPRPRLAHEEILTRCRHLLISHLTEQVGLDREEACEAADRAVRAMAARFAVALPKGDTKIAAVIAMLKRPGGVTLVEITEAVGWQKHTVRGALAGQIKKKLGITVISEKTDGRDRTYRIADVPVPALPIEASGSLGQRGN